MPGTQVHKYSTLIVSQPPEEGGVMEWCELRSLRYTPKSGKWKQVTSPKELGSTSGTLPISKGTVPHPVTCLKQQLFGRGCNY